MSDAIVARVLMKDRRIEKSIEKFSGDIPDQGSVITAEIAARALFEGWVVTIKLGPGGVPSGAQKIDRLGAVFDKQVEFVAGSQRTGAHARLFRWLADGLAFQLVGKS